MKWLILLMPMIANAGSFYIEGEIFAFDDTATVNDYQGLSPFASYSFKYKEQISSELFLSVGVKHQSSMGYREVGKGFNGPFANFELRVF